MRGHVRDHIEPFLDLHYVYTYARTGDTERVTEFFDALRDSKHYKPLVKSVTTSLAHFLVDYANNRVDDAYRHFDNNVQQNLKAIGGSNIQNELFVDAYLDVLMRTGHLEAAQAMLQQRHQQRPQVKWLTKRLEEVNVALGK
jgi:hypothetical protein